MNHEKRFIIFGLFDINAEGEFGLILSREWETSSAGRKQPGYSQSIEHIRLIREQGYHLYTFLMKYSDEHRGADGSGPSAIAGFEEKLIEKRLVNVLSNWYAAPFEAKSELPFAEELPDSSKYLEGASRRITVNAYERSGKARKACIDHYGYVCQVCEFDFKKIYGVLGEGFIHVHHIVSIADVAEEYEVDPIKDLIPVCPNCHAMIHRTSPALKTELLRELIGKSQN